MQLLSHPFPLQAIFQDLSAVAREHDYSPSQGEQRALSRTYGAVATLFMSSLVQSQPAAPAAQLSEPDTCCWFERQASGCSLSSSPFTHRPYAQTPSGLGGASVWRCLLEYGFARAYTPPVVFMSLLEAYACDGHEVDSDCPLLLPFQAAQQAVAFTS